MDPFDPEDPPDARDAEVDRLAVVRDAAGDAVAFGLAELDGLDLLELDLADLAVARFAVERGDPEDRVRLVVPLVVAISMHPFVRSFSCYPRSATDNWRGCRPIRAEGAF